MDKVVFLDRDGTINEEVNYLYRPEELCILPGVTQALARLKQLGFKLVVVTNQAGVARGYYREEDVEVLHQYLNGQLQQSGAGIDQYFYCPHHPEHGIGAYKTECSCRKPATGMFKRAEAYYEIDKQHSYMIGDKLQDTLAGRNYGVTGILVGTGYGRVLHEESLASGRTREYDTYADTLMEAVRWIENRERRYEMAAEKYLEKLIERYPVLAPVKEDVERAFQLMVHCYENGGKLLIAGNGGSSADSEHIVGELMKGFVKKRVVDEAFACKLCTADSIRGKELAGKLQGALPAIALSGHAALSTAFLNDVDGNLIFAQQTYGYGVAGDVLLGISTSGNAENIMHAAAVARAKDMPVIVLTGKDGGKLKEVANVSIVVPSNETYQIQELHLPIYHTLCLMLEEYFFA